MEIKDLDLVTIAFLDIIFWLSIFLFEIPTGTIADLLGRRISTFLGYIIQAGSIFIFIIANDPLIIGVSYLFWGMGITFVSGAYEAYVYDLISTKDKESNYQHYWGKIQAVAQIGTVLSMLCAGIMVKYFNYELTMVLTIGIYFIAMIPLFLLPNDRKSMNENSFNDSFVFIKESINIIKSSRYLMVLVYLYCVTGVQAVVVFLFIQPFLKIDHSINIELVTIIIGLSTLFLAFGSNYSSKVNDIFKKYTIFIFSALQSIAIIFMYILIGSSVVIPFFLAYLFEGMVRPLFSSYMNAEIIPKYRATVLSIIGALSTLTFAIFEPIFGIIANDISIGYSFATAGLFVILLNIPALIIWNRLYATRKVVI